MRHEAKQTQPHVNSTIYSFSTVSHYRISELATLRPARSSIFSFELQCPIVLPGTLARSRYTAVCPSEGLQQGHCQHTGPLSVSWSAKFLAWIVLHPLHQNSDSHRSRSCMNSCLPRDDKKADVLASRACMVVTRRSR